MSRFWKLADWAFIALAAVGFAFALSQTQPGRNLEAALADQAMTRMRHAVDTDIVIVAIDARSINDLDVWPWPRRHYADLLSKIAPAAPARVFIDVDFSRPSNPQDDEALRSTLAKWRGTPVVLPTFVQQESRSGGTLVETRPMRALQPFTTEASVNLVPAGDGLVRSVPPQWHAGSEPSPTLVSVLSGIELHDDVWIDYTIDPSSFRVFSFSDVLANRVPAQYFADRTVLIGATAIELGDMLPVPVYRSLPGVVVQALAIQSARSGQVRPVPAVPYWLLVAAFTAAIALAFRRLRWRQNAVIALSGILAIGLLALAAYAQLRMMVPVVPPAAAIAVVFLLTALRSLETESVRALMYAIGFRRNDALLKSVVKSSTDCIVCVDAHGTIKTANPAAARLFGCADGKLVGHSLKHFLPGLLGAVGPDGKAMIGEDVPATGTVLESEAKTLGGDAFPVELSLSRVLLDEEALFTAIVRDISERKAQQRQLQFQATHDPLTALPNRAAFAARLDALLQSRDNRVTLLMIDLDRFKEVNDTLGHNVGDYVLHEVATRLSTVMGDRGFIARIGGDEFALIVSDAPAIDDVTRLSRELIACMERPVDMLGASIDVGLSVGIARFPGDADRGDDLLRCADVAMYSAKRAHSGFEFYNAAADSNSLRRLEIAAKLRKAIGSDALKLHYQPQVCLASGRVIGAEALLRWEDPDLGKVGPDEFIALAESTDLIRPLSRWTLETAFRQSVDWAGRGLDLRVAVNVSARLLQDSAFPASVDSLLRETGASPSRIELEITESSMMQDPERALRATEELSRLGVQIAIDDFGTGYSSLAYLRDLPAHALKLDKSFVTNLDSESGDRIIADSTVKLAHALKLSVVAEGVETPAVASQLRKLGYDIAQGYLYSPALPAAAFEQWLAGFRNRTPHVA